MYWGSSPGRCCSADAAGSEEESKKGKDCEEEEGGEKEQEDMGGERPKAYRFRARGSPTVLSCSGRACMRSVGLIDQ